MNLTIPVFLDKGRAFRPVRDEHRKKGANVVYVPAPEYKTHPGLIAAIRWDYEYGLMSQADIARKYVQFASSSVTRAICIGASYPEIKAAHHAGPAPRSWRK